MLFLLPERGCTGKWLNSYCEVETVTYTILKEEFEELKEMKESVIKTCIAAHEDVLSFQSNFVKCSVLRT